MKLAVISDAHGNLTALEAVLADIDHSGITDIFSLGDLVGYGPHPEAVVRTIQERHIPTVQGNHDRAVAAPHHLEWFNPEARRSLESTRSMLSEETLAFIGSRPPSLVRHGVRFVHGFPPDSLSTYLFQVTGEDLQAAFTDMTESRCFVGHTHELVLVGHNGTGTQHHPLEEGKTPLQRDHRYIINSGAVGQPRDGDNRAKYVIYDTGADTVTVRYVTYDIQRTVDAIIAAGLPHAHADRLW